MLSQFRFLDRYELAQAPGHSGLDTVLHGVVPDQAALHGVLRQVGALGLDLVELRCPEPR